MKKNKRLTKSSSNNTINITSVLCHDVLNIICKYLPIDDICRLKRLSKYFFEFINSHNDYSLIESCKNNVSLYTNYNCGSLLIKAFDYNENIFIRSDSPLAKEEKFKRVANIIIECHQKGKHSLVEELLNKLYYYRCGTKLTSFHINHKTKYQMKRLNELFCWNSIHGIKLYMNFCHIFPTPEQILVGLETKDKEIESYYRNTLPKEIFEKAKEKDKNVTIKSLQYQKKRHESEIDMLVQRINYLKNDILNIENKLKSLQESS